MGDAECFKVSLKYYTSGYLRRGFYSNINPYFPRHLIIRRLTRPYHRNSTYDVEERRVAHGARCDAFWPWSLDRNCMPRSTVSSAWSQLATWAEFSLSTLLYHGHDVHRSFFVQAAEKGRKRRKSGTVGNSAENFDGVVTRSTQFVQHEQTFTATAKLLGPRTTMTNVPVARQLSENFPSACSFC